MAWSLTPSRRLVELLFGLEVLLFAAGIFLLAEAGELDRATLTVVMASILLVATGVCAIILRRRRRSVGYALVLLAVAGLFPVAALLAGVLGWEDPIAVFARALVPLATIWMVATFDTGGPATRVDRWVTLPAIALAVPVLLAVFLVSPAVPGAGVALQCDVPCSTGWMNLVDAPALADPLAAALALLRLVAVVGLMIGVVQRLRALTGSRRTEFAYFGAVAIAWCAIAASQTAYRLFGPAGNQGLEGAYVVQVGFRTLLPLALLLGLMLAEFRRGSALEDGFARVRACTSPHDLRQQLAALLEDDLVEVVPSGATVPGGVSGRGVTELRAADGRLVGTVVHRPDVANELPVQYAVAIPAAASAMEQIELMEQMRALQRDVQDARREVLEASDAERARIEQDLHDGAQARIVLLRARINRLAAGSGGDAAADTRMADQIRALGDDLDAILGEVRSLGSGLRPLAPGMLVPSLRDYVRQLPLSVRVQAGDLGPIPPDAELAVHFCLREALQNVAKHAGPDASAVVTLSRDAGSLAFEVRDTGRGAPTDSDIGSGRGITGMRARMQALGGVLEVEPAPGGGTAVRGSVPLAASAGQAPAASDASLLDR